MERGKADSVAIHPCRKRADFALGVRIILPFPVLAPLQVAVVELQRLDNEVRFLPSGDGLGDELGYPLVLESGLFFLVGLFLLHDALDDLIGELALLHELFHLDC